MHRRPRGYVLPTRRLAVAVALTAPLWLLSGSAAGLAVAALTTALVLAAGVADALLAPSPGEVALRRTLPATVGIGDIATGAYEIAWRTAPFAPSAAWRRVRPLAERAGGLTVSLHDALPRGLALVPESSARAGRLAAKPLVLPLAVRGQERGTFALGPVVLRIAGPLRLACASLRFAPDDQVLVAPSMAGVRGFRLLALQHRLRDAGVRAVRRRGDGTSFAQLRDYVPGDDPRRVDWKATARRGRLIAREYAVEQGQTVIILIDAGRMMTQAAGALPRFEYALSAATLLADVAAAGGDRVGLLVFDDRVRAFVPPARGPAALRLVRDALIPLRPTMVEPDYALAFRTLAERARRRALIVFFTDVLDPRASRSLIAHTVRSAARHLPLVVALRNDQLVHAAIPSREATADAVYQSAAAEELLAAREAALLQMRRAGVGVVDVSPHAMTAAVVNRYLEVKARAAL